ncbi:hypothetical protein [Algoriphagus sanaruensis]|uniref:Uncharacterized protein n=1 Tax=Algoriphagus sanaruensis TaxID=1727163 RepID=A0A142EKT3_9BACT|nr:hypothetical protein [Algoriphagus sanaruensis]AMQ55738.1 hypothetical protein AO498_04912 [Algoriphagus sanaruensis]
MKHPLWTLLVLTVIILSFLSFFVLFSEETLEPKLGPIPYVFWVSFGVTCLIVLATYLGSKVFPFENNRKS